MQTQTWDQNHTLAQRRSDLMDFCITLLLTTLPSRVVTDWLFLGGTLWELLDIGFAQTVKQGQLRFWITYLPSTKRYFGWVPISKRAILSKSGIRPLAVQVPASLIGRLLYHALMWLADHCQDCQDSTDEIISQESHSQNTISWQCEWNILQVCLIWWRDLLKPFTAHKGAQ